MNREAPPLLAPDALNPVAALEQEIERLRGELAERDGLLAIVAHELRNPLHALALQLTLAQKLAASATPAGAAPRIAKAQATLSRYTHRVTVLLELARLNVDAYPLACKAVDLAALLRTVAESLVEEAQFRKVEVRTDLPPVCAARTDAQVVEQIVDNLMLNAFKHAACNTVTLGLQVGADGAAVITVADDGCGIAPEDQSRIFERFVVAQNSPRGRGTGLGLWIVRKLVKVLGGRIELHSRPGAGTTFTVRFPLVALSNPST